MITCIKAMELVLITTLKDMELVQITSIKAMKLVVIATKGYGAGGDYQLKQFKDMELVVSV